MPTVEALRHRACDRREKRIVTSVDREDAANVAAHVEVTVRDPRRRRQTEWGRSKPLSGTRSVCHARGDALREGGEQLVALEGRALSDDDLERVADDRPGLEAEDLCVLTRQVLELGCARRHKTPQLRPPQEDAAAQGAAAPKRGRSRSPWRLTDTSSSGSRTSSTVSHTNASEFTRGLPARQIFHKLKSSLADLEERQARIPARSGHASGLRANRSSASAKAG